MKEEPHENSPSAGIKGAEGWNTKTAIRASHQEEAKKSEGPVDRPAGSSGQNEKARQQAKEDGKGAAKGPGAEKISGEKAQAKAPDSLRPNANSPESLASEYKETLQRLQAEFENFRKRSERENEAFRKIAAAKTIAEFLPVLDSVEDGIRHANALNDREMETGLGKVKGQFMQVLERNGVKQIDSKGQKFSHEMHEALMAAEDKNAEDGIVLEELQKGYSMNGLILRAAKVKVNRKETKGQNAEGK